MHAVELAEELGMRDVVVPLSPGNLSALGLIASDQRYELVTTYLRRLNDLDPAELKAQIATAEERGGAMLRERGFGPEAAMFAHALDMRYARQAFEITVDLTGVAIDGKALHSAFLATYQRNYGHVDALAEVEIVNLRTAVSGLTRKPAPQRIGRSASSIEAAMVARSPMTLRGTSHDAAVYDRMRLPVGATVPGPAIIEEAGATTILLPGWRALIDDYGNLRLSPIGAQS